MKRNIQEEMKELFGGLCYGYCLCYKFGVTDLYEMTKILLECWKRGFIENDGYISNPLSVIKLINGKRFRDIEKIRINSLEELNNKDEIYIVEYKLSPENKKSHFVIVKNGQVIFDPSGESNTVKNGKPFSWRRFI